MAYTQGRVGLGGRELRHEWLGCFRWAWQRKPGFTRNEGRKWLKKLDSGGKDGVWGGTWIKGQTIQSWSSYHVWIYFSTLGFLSSSYKSSFQVWWRRLPSPGRRVLQEESRESDGESRAGNLGSLGNVRRQSPSQKHAELGVLPLEVPLSCVLL